MAYPTISPPALADPGACLEVAFTQHRGQPPQQQDCLCAGQRLYQSDDWPVTALRLRAEDGWCAVADGVCNTPVPHRASRAVLDALKELGTEHQALVQDGWIGPRVIRRYLHPQLCAQLAGHRRSRGASTTLALLQWHQDRFSVVNVGDSRVYRIGADGQWHPCSRDHTFRESMIERGEITREQSVGSFYQELEHMLSADDSEDEFAIHWHQGALSGGDSLLVCTDGVHDTLGDPGLQAGYLPESAAADQISAYRRALLAAGAPDNFSLILIRFP
jgi:serine/threonine protein phosphatase PrpC